MSRNSSSNDLPTRPIYRPRTWVARVAGASVALAASTALLGGMLVVMDAQLSSRIQASPTMQSDGVLPRTAESAERREPASERS